MNKTIGILSVIASIVVILCILTWNHNRTMERLMNNINSSGNSSNVISTDTAINNDSQKSSEVVDQPEATVQPTVDETTKVFNLSAEETHTEIAAGVTIPTWTYGGTVPGTEIRVTQGDHVKVNVTNSLEVPITIHWHGYPIKSAMDGIPGYTQDAILPGQTFTYEFTADIVGTYWYHSHQESSKQVDMGLYGALIVVPKEEENVDQDVTLILDEWMKNAEDEMSMPMASNDSEDSSMSGMDNMGSSKTGNDDLELQEEQMMKELYNIYTVNGKSGDLIRPINVSNGEVIKLRFINAGYRTHGIHIPGQVIKVVSTDGQEIQGAEEFRDKIIEIAPGERYDIVFKVNSEMDFFVDFHDDNLYNDQMKIPIKITGGGGAVLQEEQTDLPVFDLMNYGTHSTGEFTINQTYDIDQSIELSTDTSDGSLKYTINGGVFDELQPITVKIGDLVKITYENTSKVDHPMHLHGHFFQVLAKNDQVFTGAPIMKDTLLIKPGEKYVIAFQADNPGNWVYHCHELHHAAAGMMQKIIYSDYISDYIPNPGNDYNRPE